MMAAFLIILAYLKHESTPHNHAGTSIPRHREAEEWFEENNGEGGNRDLPISGSGDKKTQSCLSRFSLVWYCFCLFGSQKARLETIMQLLMIYYLTLGGVGTIKHLYNICSNIFLHFEVVCACTSGGHSGRSM